MSKKRNFLKQAETIQEDIDQAREKKYKMLAIFADGLPYNKERYIREARKHLQQHFLSAIEAGKCLLVLKELENREVYCAALKQIGISERTGNRYAAIALRFSGLDPEIIEQFGVTKMYMLLQAPDEEIEKLQNQGTILNMDKDEIKVITTRELEERLKEETAKLTDDVKEKDDRLKIVYEDNRQQQKEIKRLKEEVIKASLQERPLDPIPEWWQRYVQVMSELDEMIRLLAENPPDLDQEANKARCRYVALNLDRQLFRANQYLKGMPIDATEFLEKRDEKLAEIKKKFDWSQILNENGEYVEFEEDEN